MKFISRVLKIALWLPGLAVLAPRALAQAPTNGPDFWHMGDWHWNHMMFGGGFMMILFWLVVIALIVVIVLLVRRGR